MTSGKRNTDQFALASCHEDRVLLMWGCKSAVNTQTYCVVEIFCFSQTSETMDYVHHAMNE